MKAHIIAVASQKGGVAKSTTSLNLAAVYQKIHGYKTAVVDMDAQGHIAKQLGLDKDKFENTMVDVLLDGLPIRKARYVTDFGFHIYPANITLSALSIESAKDNHKYPHPNHLLSQAMDALRGDYDYIFIDTPPSLDAPTLNALVASDSVLVPVHTEYLGADGLVELVDAINRVHVNDGAHCELMGVVATLHMEYRAHNMEMLKELKIYCEQKGYKVYDTFIRRAIMMAEAARRGVPGVLYDPKAAVTHDFINLSKEMLSNGTK